MKLRIGLYSTGGDGRPGSLYGDGLVYVYEGNPNIAWVRIGDYWIALRSVSEVPEGIVEAVYIRDTKGTVN